MNPDQRCDLLIRNAYVISVDAQRRVFSPGAVAVRGHTLVAVGPEREVMQAMSAARTIDAEGAVLHPGFIDAHNHVVGAGCRGVFANDADDPASGVNYAAWKAEVWCPGVYLSMGLAGKVECRMPELLRRGVDVTLGSDSARSSALGDEALLAHLVAANAGERLAPETILEMLSINAARSAGLEVSVGS